MAHLLPLMKYFNNKPNKPIFRRLNDPKARCFGVVSIFYQSICG